MMEICNNVATFPTSSLKFIEFVKKTAGVRGMIRFDRPSPYGSTGPILNTAQVQQRYGLDLPEGCRDPPDRLGLLK